MADRSAMRSVLAFWFGPPGDPARGETRKEWWRKDAAFDAQIRERFGALHEKAGQGVLDGWRESADGCLALLILLDQFSRNLHRGDARTYANDTRARALARHAIASGFDEGRPGVERVFFYMPFMHSESLADQKDGLALFATLPDDSGGRENKKAARKHLDIIERFGRFPHRNAVLGRRSTPEEIVFLDEPGSSF